MPSVRFGTIDGRVVTCDVLNDESVANTLSRVSKKFGIECAAARLCVGGRLLDVNATWSSLSVVSGPVAILRDELITMPFAVALALLLINTSRIGPVVDVEGGVRLHTRLLNVLRPMLQRSRGVILIGVDLETGSVTIMLHSVSDMLHSFVDTTDKFVRDFHHICWNFDERYVVPVVISTVNPVHTTLFLNSLPWATDGVGCCDCCGRTTCVAGRKDHETWA